MHAIHSLRDPTTLHPVKTSLSPRSALILALLALGLTLASGCSHLSRDSDGTAGRLPDGQQEPKTMGYQKDVPNPSTPTLPTSPVPATANK